MSKSKTKSLQRELPHAGLVFNLARESGEDPIRVMLDQARALQKADEARVYEQTMQLLLSKCPGFISTDAPRNETSAGKLVVEPGRIVDARAWLKRKFHINPDLRLSHDFGLCLEIRPKVKRAGRHGRRNQKVSFAKVEQFEFTLAESKETE